MNIIVTGGSDFNDWQTFYRSLSRLSFSWTGAAVLYSDAGACDDMARRFADMSGLRHLRVPVSRYVDWPDAYRFRNMDIVSVCDGAVLFWDKKSPDIDHLISVLRLARRRFVVFDYYGNLVLNEGAADVPSQ